jgi:hypothetical protein
VDKGTIQAKTMRTFQAARLNPHQDVSRKLLSGSRLHMRYGQGKLTLALQRVDTYPQEAEWQAVTAALPLDGAISLCQAENEKGYFLYARDIPVKQNAKVSTQPITR